MKISRHLSHINVNNFYIGFYNNFKIFGATTVIVGKMRSTCASNSEPGVKSTTVLLYHYPASGVHYHYRYVHSFIHTSSADLFYHNEAYNFSRTCFWLFCNRREFNLVQLCCINTIVAYITGCQIGLIRFFCRTLIFFYVNVV